MDVLSKSSYREFVIVNSVCWIILQNTKPPHCLFRVEGKLAFIQGKGLLLLFSLECLISPLSFKMERKNCM